MKEYEIKEHQNIDIASEPVAAYSYGSAAHSYLQDTTTNMWNLFCALNNEQKRSFATQIIESMTEDELQKCRIAAHYRKLWQDTCVYSGPGPWITESAHFKKLKSMADDAITFLSQYAEECPEQMKRHVCWVSKLLSKS